LGKIVRLDESGHRAKKTTSIPSCAGKERDIMFRASAAMLQLEGSS
jgi:hypothetical protein